MSRISLAAEDLARLTSNALLFINDKSAYTGGLVRFRASKRLLSVLATDDYVGFWDVVPSANETAIDFALNKTLLQQVDKFARDNKKYDIDLEFDKRYEKLTLKVAEDAITLELPEFPDSASHNFEVVEALIFDPEFADTTADVFAVHPDRLAKLYRMKRTDSAPIDIKFAEAGSGRIILRFKLGKTCRGIINPIRREVVDPEFLWTNEETTEASVS